MTRQGMLVSKRPEQGWVSDCSVTISSAPRATLLSAGTQTLSPIWKRKSSLHCPLKTYLYERKVKNKNQLLCVCGSACWVHSTVQFSAPPALLVKAQTGRSALAGCCHPSPLQINKIFFTYDRWLCGFHSALVIHLYLPAFMSHGSFTLVTET